MTKEELLKLYRAPFRLDRYHIYIHDANYEMVADFMPVDYHFRPRGYGRFKQMENGDFIHDEMEKFLNEIVKDCRDEPLRCLAAINQAWGVEQ